MIPSPATDKITIESPNAPSVLIPKSSSPVCPQALRQGTASGPARNRQTIARFASGGLIFERPFAFRNLRS